MSKTASVEKVLKVISREEEERRTQAIAAQLGVGYINLVSYPILPDMLRLIPREVAAQYHVVAYLKVDKVLRVATSRPNEPKLAEVLSLLQEHTKLEPQLLVCSESSIRYILKLYDNLPAIGPTEEKVIVSEQETNAWEDQIQGLLDLKERISTVPTTKLLDVVFAGAIKTTASDIHLEPTEHNLRIRYRIDGVLQDITQLPLTAYKAIRSRIKYLAQLRLDVSTTPQDGRFAVKAAGKDIDIRVSLIPGPNGEFIVMRLLLHDTALLALDELSIRPEALAMIREAIKKPHGIIFNTGPTGSGKTTTLYAILNELNKPGVKIITLEDPIEYKIAGINQSQVEIEKGYDFATGLRAVVRQDPDILLVGEIRDAETANTAIHAALTGHLVLTTLHTNSAAAALPRLIDMGVPPYLLAGSVNLIIGQRLVRKICRVCQGTGAEAAATGKPCLTCSGTHYKGRVAIIETLVPNDELNKLIAQKAPVSQFEEAARASGMVTMEQDGMLKVKQGLTTREEVARVTQE
ncbi:type II/IV secretion system protein [Candidatus Berkelbacteria bacterium]|nr:type II/IV secretion system protein [Candidatus Berkelbacteria bacterium]